MAKKTVKAPVGGNWLDKWNDIAVTMDRIEKDIEVISTGSPTLDLALMHGGMAKGCITRIYGRKGSCKTTLCQRMAARSLEENRPVLWIDAECSFIPYIARANGIPANDPRFRIWRGNPTSETKLTYENMAALIESWLNDREWCPEGCLIVVDSLSAIVTEKMLAGEVEDQHIAAVARMNSKWFPTIMPLIVDTNSNIVCVQQMRANISPMAWEKETPGGGFALEHYASVEIKLQKVKKEDLGSRIRFDIRANKFAHGYVEGEFSFRTDYGIDTPRELIDLGVELGVVTQAGSFFKWSDETGELQSFQGMENARQYLITNPDKMDWLEATIRERAKQK